MIMSIVRGAQGILWIVFVLGMFMYLFSISLAQGALEVCHTVRSERMDPHTPAACRRWGSILWAMLSLYEAMTGGISWGELLDSLEPVGFFYMCLFMLYITLAIFVVSNIITGIFVETAMQAAKQDHESVMYETALK